LKNDQNLIKIDLKLNISSKSKNLKIGFIINQKSSNSGNKETLNPRIVYDNLNEKWLKKEEDKK